jgi:hypothetical protein
MSQTEVIGGHSQSAAPKKTELASISQVYRFVLSAS